MTKKYRHKNKKCKNYRKGNEGCIEIKCTNGSKRMTPEQMTKRHFPKRRMRGLVIHSKLSDLPYDKIFNSNVEKIRFYEQYYSKDQINKGEHKSIYCTINGGDFENCHKLTELNIPWGHLIKKDAFLNCSKIKNVLISEGSKIEEGAFPLYTNIIME